MILRLRLEAIIKYVVTTLYSAIKMGFVDKKRAATLSKRSFIEEAVKCLLRELVKAGHSIGMCLIVSGQ